MDWKESNPEKRNGYRGKANREEKKIKDTPEEKEEEEEKKD